MGFAGRLYVRTFLSLTLLRGIIKKTIYNHVTIEKVGFCDGLVSLLNVRRFLFECREYFESGFGEGSVDDVRIMFHPETGRSRRFGFVTFKTPATATAVMAQV